MVNFYELLGINYDATNEEINQAYRKKSIVHHPDKNNGSETAEVMFKMLGLAKETLLDDNKRLEHDYAVGIKSRPLPEPRIIEKTIVKKSHNTDLVLGVGLLGLILGLALSGKSSK